MNHTRHITKTMGITVAQGHFKQPCILHANLRQAWAAHSSCRTVEARVQSKRTSRLCAPLEQAAKALGTRSVDLTCLAPTQPHLNEYWLCTSTHAVHIIRWYVWWRTVSASSSPNGNCRMSKLLACFRQLMAATAAKTVLNLSAG